MSIVTKGLLVAFLKIASMGYTLYPNQAGVLTNFGEYTKTISDEGPHLKAPWTRVHGVETRQLYEDDKLDNLKTKDGYFVSLPLQIQYRVSDPYKFLFSSQKPVYQMKKLIDNAVRSKVAQMEFDQLFTSKDDLEKSIEERETQDLAQFGILLLRVVPGDPQADPGIVHAKTERIREIEEAKGHMEAQILDGKGIAGKRKEIFLNYPEQVKALLDSHIPRESAEAMVVLSMGYDTLRDAASHGNTVITTTEANDQLMQFKKLSAAFDKDKPSSSPPTADNTGEAPAGPLPAAA